MGCVSRFISSEGSALLGQDNHLGNMDSWPHHFPTHEGSTLVRQY
jgi:hypothetical protein